MDWTRPRPHPHLPPRRLAEPETIRNSDSLAGGGEQSNLGSLNATKRLIASDLGRLFDWDLMNCLLGWFSVHTMSMSWVFSYSLQEDEKLRTTRRRKNGFVEFISGFFEHIFNIFSTSWKFYFKISPKLATCFLLPSSTSLRWKILTTCFPMKFPRFIGGNFSTVLCLQHAPSSLTTLTQPKRFFALINIGK